MTDTYISSVTSLLHFTDDDISDSAFSDYTWNRNNTVLNATGGVFGGQCLQLSGSNSYLKALKQIGPYTGDFTAEAFINISGLASTPSQEGNIFSFSGTNSGNTFSWNLSVYSPSTGSSSGYLNSTIGSASGSQSSGMTTIQGAYSFLWNTFYHVAFVKQGTTGTLYVNGTSVATATVPANFFNANSVGNMWIGTVQSGNNNFNGLISEPRITTVARYTSTFTPDTTYYDSPITYTRAYPINQTFTSGVPANFASFVNNTLATQGYNGTDALTISSSVTTGQIKLLKLNTIPYSKSFTCTFSVSITSDAASQKSIHLALLPKNSSSKINLFYHYLTDWKWDATSTSDNGNLPVQAVTPVSGQPIISDTSTNVPGTITVAVNNSLTIGIKVYPISTNSFNTGLSSVEFFVNGLPIYRSVVTEDFYIPCLSTNGNNNISLISIVGDVYTVGSSYPYTENFTSNIPVGTGMHYNASGNFSEVWDNSNIIRLNASSNNAQNTWILNKLDYMDSFTFTVNMYISTDTSGFKHSGISLISPSGRHIRLAHHSDKVWYVSTFTNELTGEIFLTPSNIPDVISNGDISTPVTSTPQEVVVSYSTYNGLGYISLKLKGTDVYQTFNVPANIYKPAIFLYGNTTTISSISAVTPIAVSPTSIYGRGLSSPQGLAYGVYGQRIIPSEIKTLPLPTILRTKNYYYTGTGSISGIVISNNVPLSNCIVKLFDKSNGTLLESVYSDNGYFIFHQYDTNEHQYYTVAETINDSWVVPNISTGSAAITGFLEGIDVPTLVTLTDETNNSTVSSLTTMDYSFGNCVEGRQYFVKYNGAIKEVTTSLNMVRGYLTGNVSTNACTGSNFAIKCYRSDGMFIGLYPLVDSSYTIPNLDVLSLYDIVLFDLNTILESQILSKRIPTAYDEGYTPPTLITNTDGILITTTDGTYITTT